MITVEQAIHIVDSNSTRLNKKKRVSLSEATGYVLAEDVISPIDMPPFRQSAMDGYAVCIHDSEYYHPKMKAARMQEWKTFQQMQLFDDAAGIRMEHELRNSGETVVGNVCVATIKNENEPQEKFKFRMTADGGPFRAPTTHLVVPISNTEKRIIIVRGKAIGNQIGFSDVQNAYLHAKSSSKVWYKLPDIICSDSFFLNIKKFELLASP